MNWIYMYSTLGGCYTVGFYSPDGEFHPESDHRTSEAAAERVHYLNGGGTQSGACREGN